VDWLVDWLRDHLGTNYGPALVAGAVALVVGLVTGCITLIVAWLNPSVTSLRARRQAVDAAFDKAVAALLMVQAARHYAGGVDAETHRGTPVQLEAFNLRQREAGIDRYLTRTDEAKLALVAVSLYFPEVEDWLAELEFPEAQLVPRRKALQRARRRAVKSERLWRRRKNIERGTPTLDGATVKLRARTRGAIDGWRNPPTARPPEPGA